MLNFCQYLLSINIVNLVFQVYRAVDACKSVLRGLHDSKIAQRELDRVNISSLTSYFTLLHTLLRTLLDSVLVFPLILKIKFNF